MYENLINSLLTFSNKKTPFFFNVCYKVNQMSTLNTKNNINF